MQTTPLGCFMWYALVWLYYLAAKESFPVFHCVDRLLEAAKWIGAAFKDGNLSLLDAVWAAYLGNFRRYNAAGIQSSYVAAAVGMTYRCVRGLGGRVLVGWL